MSRSGASPSPVPSPAPHTVCCSTSASADTPRRRRTRRLWRGPAPDADRRPPWALRPRRWRPAWPRAPRADAPRPRQGRQRPCAVCPSRPREARDWALRAQTPTRNGTGRRTECTAWGGTDGLKWINYFSLDKKQRMDNDKHDNKDNERLETLPEDSHCGRNTSAMSLVGRPRRTCSRRSEHSVRKKRIAQSQSVMFFLRLFR